MFKKICLGAVAILLLLTACSQAPFDANKARDLASLHSTPAEYTTAEIKEVEEVMESFVTKNEKMVNDVINEKDATQRKHKMIKMAAEYKSDEEIYDAIGQLIVVLRDSPQSDKAKFDSLMKRILELQFSLEMIRDEM